MPSSPKEDSLLISSLILRRLVGILGIVLPPGLILTSGFLLQPSISEYYHTGVRDLFVGTMCAVGVFLSCYKGYDIKDWVFSLIAGIAALLVALVPVAREGATGVEVVRGGFHLASAALFLGCLAYLSLVQFTKTDPKKRMTLRKTYRNHVYRFCGWVMVGSLLIILFYKLPFTKDFFSFLTPIKPVFTFESVAVIAFGISWLIKGEGLLGDKAPAKGK